MSRHPYVYDPELWALVPCQLRLSFPGRQQMVHPIPGADRGAMNRNRHLIVWCECEAQTAAQWEAARRARDGEPVRWPTVCPQKRQEALGVVPIGPKSAKAALALHEAHKAARAARRAARVESAT
jgi:hypothetical protein